MQGFPEIAGGVALILFGVRYLRQGLDRLFGPQLGTWAGRMARGRIRAFCSGLGVAVVAPSSTTISMLAVQTVQAGHMTAGQMLAMMFGADVGLTVMVLLIALRVEQVAPLLILIGVLLFQFTRQTRLRGIGQVTLSLGLIFIAIGIIKRGAEPLAASQDFLDLIQIVQRYPIGLAVLAAVLAVAMQSSTATIGLVIGLAAKQAVGLELAVAVVAGANVGIVLTTLIVGWSRVESRRLAVGNLLAKLVIAIAVVAALGPVVWMLERLPGGTDRQVAYAHIGFNVLLAAVCLPLVSPIARLVTFLIPSPPSSQVETFGPRFVSESPPGSVAVAISQSQREIMRVAEIVRSMLEDLWQAIKTNNTQLALRVSERDDQVDLLDTHIKRFLTRLAALEPSRREAAEQMLQLRYLNQLETIGDTIDKNLSELAIKKAKLRVGFSQEGWAQLDDFHQKVAENMLIAETTFATRDRMLARQLLRHKERISQLDAELRDQHFARLNAGMAQSHESSAIHLDLLTYLKHINSSVSHVAYAILEDPPIDGGAEPPMG